MEVTRQQETPRSSGNLAPLPVWHPLLKGAASHTLKQLTLPQDWDAFGQTTLLNSPRWRDSHFPHVSLLKKETLFLSNGIQQFKKKKNRLNFVTSFGLLVRQIWVLILSKCEICLVL